jgi:hypothetical protein
MIKSTLETRFRAAVKENPGECVDDHITLCGIYSDAARNSAKARLYIKFKVGGRLRELLEAGKTVPTLNGRTQFADCFRGFEDRAKAPSRLIPVDTTDFKAIDVIREQGYLSERRATKLKGAMEAATPLTAQRRNEVSSALVDAATEIHEKTKYMAGFEKAVEVQDKYIKLLEKQLAGQRTTISDDPVVQNNAQTEAQKPH